MIGKICFFVLVSTMQIITHKRAREILARPSAQVVRAVPAGPFGPGALLALSNVGIEPVYDTERPQCHQILETVRSGPPVLVGGVWVRSWEVVRPYNTRAEEVAALAAVISQESEQRQGGGIVVAGLPVMTTPDFIARISGAVMSESSEYTWVVNNGMSVVTLTKPQVIDIFNAVDNHIKACVARQSELLALLNDESTNLDTLDITAGWPSNV